MRYYVVDVTRTTTHVVEARTESEARASVLGDHNKVDEKTVDYRIEEVRVMQ